MDRRRHIEEKLRDQLDAAHIDVIDESHLHAGHEGAKSGGGHFHAIVVAAAFDGLSRVAAQRLVYQALSEEMGGEIHALRLTLHTPEKWAAQSTDSGS
jgi:BolA protein